ncbi:MAG: thiamine phosphate synthase [Acidobacteria bacterium]|nr:thiamine phosphate synthase [Acidobacteriota bacterium]
MAALRDEQLYLVTGPVPGSWAEVLRRVEAAVAAGVRVVQYREKSAPALEMAAQLRQLLSLCRPRGARVLVNDRLDVALAAGADGVHLGEDDLPWTDARRLGPRPFLLGCSVSSAESAARAIAAGADYVGLGPAYRTATKADAGEPIALELITRIAEMCHAPGVRIPLVAIGGIGPGLAAPLVKAGADAVAVIAAVMQAPDPAAAARGLLDEVAEARRWRP